MKQVKLLFLLFALVLTTLPLESAERITGRYALILSDPAPAERFTSRHELRAAAGMSYRQQIDQAQKSVRDELGRRRIGVLSSAQDNSLAAPAGFPKCQGNDCVFSNNKVIVARSYVRQLAAGSPTNPAADSRPDDYSPRDRVGHGTALAMIAASLPLSLDSVSVSFDVPAANLSLPGRLGYGKGAVSRHTIRCRNCNKQH
jgi:hypothetical protein